MEIWKTVNDKANKKGVYEVSIYGEVRSKDQVVSYRNSYGTLVSYKRPGKVLRQRSTRFGYLCISLGAGNPRRVHRLVAQTFIPNPDNLPEVNHKDCNPANNDVENLEWVSHRQNMEYSHSLGRGFMKTKKPVVGKNLRTGEEHIYESERAGAKATGCSWRKISKCCLGRQKQTGGYSWRFLN